MNQFSYLFQHRAKRKKSDTAQLAAQLAPLEERNGRAVLSDGVATQEVGAIVVHADNLNLSNELLEGQYGKGFMGMEPVVLIILGVMLAFIGFVAWQISLMPPE